MFSTGEAQINIMVNENEYHECIKEKRISALKV